MQISIGTNREKEVINISERVQQAVDEAGLETGICLAFLTHTTAALTTADLDPGTGEDMLDAYTGMLPKIDYRHPHDPQHAPDHILSSIIGPSVLIPVRNGELVLGTWQKVVLIEFNGPQERMLELQFIEAA